MPRFCAVLFSMMLVFLLAAVADAKPIVGLSLRGDFVTAIADGKVALVPIASRKALPGERIRWQIDAKNSGDATARNFIAAGKIVSATTLVPSSVTATGARVEYSLDNGATWSATPMRVIHSAQGDRVTPAELTSYTAIRWVSTASLAPGTSRRFVYDVVVR